MCSGFDTIPAEVRVTDGQTDGRTDGIAIASRALVMQALRREVKTKKSLFETPLWGT